MGKIILVCGTVALGWRVVANTLNFFETLKAETAGEHARMEEQIDPLSRFRSREEYRKFLAALFAFYRPAEEWLGNFSWAETGLDFEGRRKLPWLRADLKVLSLRPEEIPAEIFSPGARSRAFAVGCLYVLEGATLGGQVIGRHLAALGIGPENGGRFYAGYGEATGRRWLDFKGKGEDAAGGAEGWNESVAGALFTFRKMAEQVSLAEREKKAA